MDAPSAKWGVHAYDKYAKSGLRLVTSLHIAKGSTYLFAYSAYHLEPCRPSTSKAGPSISLYYNIEGATFDIEGATFDIEGRKMTFDIGYNITTRYRRF
jgi:hypothetical protein